MIILLSDIMIDQFYLNSQEIQCSNTYTIFIFVPNGFNPRKKDNYSLGNGGKIAFPFANILNCLKKWLCVPQEMAYPQGKYVAYQLPKNWLHIALGHGYIAQGNSLSTWQMCYPPIAPRNGFSPLEMVAHCFQTWLYCSWDIWLFLKANVLPINHLGKMIVLPWEMVWPKHLFLMDLLFLKEIGYHL